MFAKSKRGQANVAELAQEAACTNEGGCLNRRSVLPHVPRQQLSPLGLHTCAACSLSPHRRSCVPALRSVVSAIPSAVQLHQRLQLCAAAMA